MTSPGKQPLPSALTTWLESVRTLAATAIANGIQPSPAMARMALAGMTQQLGGAGPEVACVEHLVLDDCPQIALRLYDPAPNQYRATLLYIHGGGHMAGSIDVYDPIIRRVANATQCRTVAIDYRLAPEHPYPYGLEDCKTVLRALPAWIAAHGGAQHEHVIVAGDSGGGALTATLAAHALTDASLRIRGQILIYPSLDYTLSQPSVQENGQGYLLDADKIRWYFDNYFQAQEDRHVASPLFMPMRGMAPALLFTAGYCPLRDEGYAYAQSLKDAGVACTHHNLADMIHAYLNIHTLVPQACDMTYQTMGNWVESLLR